jgi:antitoxin Phd
VFVCGLTFELTPTAEAGRLGPGGENVPRTSDRAKVACRSGSGVERGVRRRRAGARGKLVSILVIVRRAMQTWPIQDAKARFSEFLETCLAEGPQMVTKRGAEAAVLVPVDEWRRLKAAARPSLKQLLLSDQGRTELVVPARGAARRRVLAAAR